MCASSRTTVQNGAYLALFREPCSVMIATASLYYCSVRGLLPKRYGEKALYRGHRPIEVAFELVAISVTSLLTAARADAGDHTRQHIGGARMMTRTVSKAEIIRSVGGYPIVANAFDAEAVLLAEAAQRHILGHARPQRLTGRSEDRQVVGDLSS